MGLRVELTRQVISELPSAALAGSDPSRRPMVTIEWVEEMEAYPPMNGQSTPSQPRWRSWAAEAEDSRAFWGGRSPVSTPIIEPAAYGEAGDESTNEPMVDVHGDEPEQVTEEEEDISGMEQWDHPAYACFRHLLPAMEELDRREEEEEVAKRAKECVDRQWEWAKDKVDLWERLIDSRGVREKSEVRRMVRVEGVSESEAWVRTVRDRDPQYLRLEHPRWSRTPAELGVRPLQVVWSKSRGVAA